MSAPPQFQMMAPPPALAPHENQGWKAREGFGASEDGDVVVNPIKLPFGDVFSPPHGNTGDGLYLGLPDISRGYRWNMMMPWGF